MESVIGLSGRVGVPQPFECGMCGGQGKCLLDRENRWFRSVLSNLKNNRIDRALKLGV